jgi:hypothetical protein
LRSKLIGSAHRRQHLRSQHSPRRWAHAVDTLGEQSVKRVLGLIKKQTLPPGGGDSELRADPVLSLHGYRLSCAPLQADPRLSLRSVLACQTFQPYLRTPGERHNLLTRACGHVCRSTSSRRARGAHSMPITRPHDDDPGAPTPPHSRAARVAHRGARAGVARARARHCHCHTRRYALGERARQPSAWPWPAAARPARLSAEQQQPRCASHSHAY